jgi:hypothetical protein
VGASRSLSHSSYLRTSGAMLPPMDNIDKTTTNKEEASISTPTCLQGNHTLGLFDDRENVPSEFQRPVASLPNGYDVFRRRCESKRDATAKTRKPQHKRRLFADFLPPISATSTRTRCFPRPNERAFPSHGPIDDVGTDVHVSGTTRQAGAHYPEHQEPMLGERGRKQFRSGDTCPQNAIPHITTQWDMNWGNLRANTPAPMYTNTKDSHTMARTRNSWWENLRVPGVKFRDV